MAALITQAEYARRRGVSRQAVSKAVKMGRIRTVKGKIDPEQADADWNANTGPTAPSTARRGTAEDVETKLNYSTSRAIREAYNARIARLEYEERVGALVPAEKVKMQAFNTARKARDLLLAIPDRLAPILSGTTTQVDCHRILLEEIRRVCDELNHGWKN